MRSTADRIRQALSFEIIGLLIVTPLFSYLFGHPMQQTGVLVLLGATAATTWNYLFNLGFDRALMRWHGSVHKTVPLRVLHATLFECTFLIVLLPIFTWWMSLTVVEALEMELTFAAFYLVYTFVFTWAYDALFPPQGIERTS